MTKPFETVRTDRFVYITGEAVPSWRKPQHCGIHCVSWWSDEFDIINILEKKLQCPCCNGTILFAFLAALEEPRIQREREKRNIVHKE